MAASWIYVIFESYLWTCEPASWFSGAASWISEIVYKMQGYKVAGKIEV